MKICTREDNKMPGLRLSAAAAWLEGHRRHPGACSGAQLCMQLETSYHYKLAPEYLNALHVEVHINSATAERHSWTSMAGQHSGALQYQTATSTTCTVHQKIFLPPSHSSIVSQSRFTCIQHMLVDASLWLVQHHPCTFTTLHGGLHRRLNYQLERSHSCVLRSFS